MVYDSSLFTADIVMLLSHLLHHVCVSLVVWKHETNVHQRHYRTPRLYESGAAPYSDTPTALCGSVPSEH